MAHQTGHNKIMGLGTSYVDENNYVRLSSIGLNRADKVVDAYYHDGFQQGVSESVLLSGAYYKEHKDKAPIGSEAVLMADYIMRKHGLPANIFLLEERSTDTYENLVFSQQEFPEWFECVTSGDDGVIAMVSGHEHLSYAQEIAVDRLQWRAENLIMLPVGREIGVTAVRYAA